MCLAVNVPLGLTIPAVASEPTAAAVLSLAMYGNTCGCRSFACVFICQGIFGDDHHGLGAICVDFLMSLQLRLQYCPPMFVALQTTYALTSPDN